MVSTSRWRRSFALLLTLLVLSAPVGVAADSPPGAEAQQGTFDWWTPRYLIDYGLFAAGLTGYIVGGDTPARSDALIGPSYDPENPVAIFDDPSVDQLYLSEGDRESVPTVWIHRSIGAAAVFIAGVEALEWHTGRGSMHQVHDAFVGYAETVAVTAGITEFFKPLVGRLRPDFGDRARRYHCSTQPQQFGAICDGYRDRPLADDPEEAAELLEDGRRSFISGHSSHSFNLFGYTALLVGGRYVWGAEATDRSQATGLLGLSAMMGAASYISATRIADGRHHVTDVVAGSIIGLGVANFSYWRRFDRDGQLRAQSGGDTGVQLQPSFPFPGLTFTVHH